MMVSMRHLSPKDLVEIAKQMTEKGFNKDTSTAAVLITTAQLNKGKEEVISQVIVPCMEVDI